MVGQNPEPKVKTDVKGESAERMTPDELKELLEKKGYGKVDEVSFVAPMGNNSWALNFTPDPKLGLGNVTYTIIVPEGAFRREPDITKEPIGFKEDGTPVLPMVPLRPDNPSATKNEIQIVLLNDGEKGDPDLVKKWLKDTLTTGMTFGPEFEFGIREHDVDTPEGKRRAAERAFTICREGMVEAFHNMRELALPDPAFGYVDFQRILARLEKEIFDEANEEVFIVELTNMSPERVAIGESPYTTFTSADFARMPENARAGLGYIEAATLAYESKMLKTLAALLKADPDLRAAMNQIAISLGAQSDPAHPDRSLGDVLMRKFKFDVWTTRSLHISIGVPQYPNGMVPLQAMKNSANAAILDTELFDVLNYSGNMVHGARIQLPGRDGILRDVLSARALIKNILPTSRAGSLIPRDINFKQMKIELTLRGLANMFDRATYRIAMSMKSGLKRVFGAQHGDVRSRDSGALIKFLAFLEERGKGNMEAKLQTGARLEGTSPDVGPEILGANSWAVAMRAIAHRASMMAAAEGMDYVEWRAKEGALGGKTPDQIYEECTSEKMHAKRMRVLRGEIDVQKIREFELLIDVVERKTQEELDAKAGREGVELPRHWRALFDDARKGIAELKQVSSIFGRHRRMWEGIFATLREKRAREGNEGAAGIDMYEAFLKSGGGMAAKAILLTNTEIATILVDRFKVGKLRIPNGDGTFKEFNLDDEVIRKWLEGEGTPGAFDERAHNQARAYLMTLLFDLHAQEALGKFREEKKDERAKARQQDATSVRRRWHAKKKRTETGES